MDYFSPKSRIRHGRCLTSRSAYGLDGERKEKMKTVVSSLNWNLGSIIQLSTHESMDPLIMPQTALSAWLSAWKAMEREPCSKNGHAVFVSIFHSVPYMHSYNAVKSIHRCMHLCLLCIKFFALWSSHCYASGLLRFLKENSMMWWIRCCVLHGEFLRVVNINVNRGG